MSRVEPNRNVYVGHRYVPKIMGEWDKKNQYEGLSIVTHQGNSYTSKKRVPVGIDILNEEFWVVTGNYNAQVEEYRKEVRDLSTYVDTELDKKSDITYVDNELGKKTDKTYVDTELDKKSDITYVDTELDKKSDITYVDNELAKKPDLITQSVNYYIPDDYTTLSSAISDIYNKHSNGVSVNIVIRSGHRPKLRAYILDAVLPNVKLQSEDDIVQISDNLDDHQDLITLKHVFGFQLDCLIDMGGQGNHGLYLQGLSNARINSGCGVINAGGDGLHVRHGSTAFAQFTNFTGAGKNITGSEERAGISAWGGRVNAHGADVSGSAHHGVRAAYSGVLDFERGTADNCGYHGIRASNSGRVSCPYASAQNNGIHGIYALNNSFINADRSNASNNKRVAYNATGGSIIHANLGVADGSDVAVDAGRASTINFISGSAFNCVTAGIISSHSSTVEARNITIQGEQLRGVDCYENSTVNVQNTLIYGSRIYGIEVKGASNVNAGVTIVRNTAPTNHNSHGVVCNTLSRLNISGGQVWNNGGKDIMVDSGGQVSARQTLTTSGVKSGEPNIDRPQIEDVNLSAFNTINRAGIIFD